MNASGPDSGGAADALLRLHRDRVQPDWLDYNGHMNEAYYVLVFSRATDAFMDLIGMDEANRVATETSIYTLESHILYLEEVGSGEPLAVTSQLLGHDAKRFHLFHTMHHAESGARLATAEMLLLNIDMTGPKATPFQAAVAAKLDAIAQAQAGLPPPAEAGRAVALKR